MAIEAKCDKCEGELNDFGGIAWSPPLKHEDGSEYWLKYHLCLDCWYEFKDWMNQ